MTILEMMNALETCGDATVLKDTADDGSIVYDVTIEDFEGFGNEWEEIDRDYVCGDLVEEFEDALKEQALRVEGDFYYTYYFDGFRIDLGYSSYDI